MEMQDFSLVGGLLLLGSLAVVAIVFAARYVQALLGDAKYAEITRTIRTYIQAAEQMAKSGQIQEDARYQWVVDRIVEKFPQLSEQQIEVFIESAVYVLNAGASLVDSLDKTLGHENKAD